MNYLAEIIPYLIIGAFIGGMVLTYMVILLTRFITRNDD